MVHRHMGSRAYIGIGSNLGQRIYALGYAVQRLRALGEAVDCSPVYETVPVGYADQPDFLNMVVGITTQQTPFALLDGLQRIELEYGRQRLFQNGPRTLDLDVLLFDDCHLHVDRLQIPHPRMLERGFVMIPLAHLAPNLVLSGGRRVKEIADNFRAEGDIRHVGCFW